MKKTYAFIIALVLVLLPSCLFPEEETKSNDKTKLIGTWYDSGTDTYCIFREDGTYSWGIGSIGDKNYTYTVENIFITINKTEYSEYYTYRIVDNKLYLCENSFEVEYVRVKED